MAQETKTQTTNKAKAPKKKVKRGKAKSSATTGNSRGGEGSLPWLPNIIVVFSPKSGSRPVITSDKTESALIEAPNLLPNSIGSDRK
jgi:hypothetical protein